jgi:hypothetical protein
MLNLVSAHIIDVSIEDVKRVREMLCENILKETINQKGNFYSGAP